MRFSRMTLGSIDDLVPKNSVELMGDGTLSEGIMSGIKLTIPNKETRKIYEKMPEFDNSARFLDWINQYLKSNKLYIEFVNYNYSKHFAKKIAGTFYRDK